MENQVITTVKPISSVNDDRSYRAITLGNKLDVMLISDPTTDKAAAGMDVLVGHFQDPDNIPGLAHFCEHMLFLGTEKYPDESSYDGFLSSHGGMSNAYTSSESTNYFFDISHEYLKEAMDRFAQFFLSPLFTADSTDRELNAVDSEHAKNLQSDSRRLYQLTKTTANPKHPFSKFATGSKETLSDIPDKQGIKVREELLKFHSKYYSSNVMKLCVIGRESLDALQEMVVELFSGVKNLNRERYMFQEKDIRPFSETYALGSKFYVEPVKDVRFVTVAFPLAESLDDKYDTKPNRYLSHLFGHEGEGSILSLLRAKGWGSELMAGSSRYGHDVDIFKVRIDLTEEGLEHVNDVVSIVMQYAELLKQSKPQEWIFKELQNTGEIKFRFSEKGSPINVATSTASSMQLFPLEKVLSGWYIYEKYSPEDITSVVDQFTVDNLILTIVSKDVTSRKSADFEQEKWYGTKYLIEKFSDEEKKQWSTTTTIDKALTLPPKNEFIPTNFDIKNKAEIEQRKKVNDTGLTYPSKLDSSPSSLVYYKLDDRFGLPRAEIKLNIILPIAQFSPRNSYLNSLLISVFKDAINEWAYNADVAGLEFDLYSTTDGMLLRVWGYNEKLMLFTLRLFEKLIGFALADDETFSQHKERYALRKEKRDRELANFAKEQPWDHARYELENHLLSYRWRIDQKLAAGKNVTFGDFQKFARILLGEYRLEWLLMGNLGADEVNKVVSDVENCLNKAGGGIVLEEQFRGKKRVVKLQDGETYVLQKKEYNPENNNSALYQYYQIGLNNVEILAKLNMLTQLTKVRAFEQLRTKEQLGYLVWAGTRSVFGVCGWRVIIQSSVKGADYLDERVESFIEGFRKDLQELEEKEFTDNVNALIAKLEEKDKKLSQEVSRHWEKISNHKYNFDSAEQQVKFLKASMNKAVLIKFFERYVGTKDRRAKMSIQLFGKDHSIPEDTGNKYYDHDAPTWLGNDSSSFKLNQTLFPLNT